MLRSDDTDAFSGVVQRDATIHQSIAAKEDRHGDDRDAGRARKG
jgi:hypothetical protein